MFSLMFKPAFERNFHNKFEVGQGKGKRTRQGGNWHILRIGYVEIEYLIGKQEFVAIAYICQ